MITMNNDLISRQATIDAFDCSVGGVPVEAVKYVSEYADKMMHRIKALPSEPAISISWIEKEIERLESYENSFAVLDAMRLKALIKRWRGEDNG